MPDNAVRTTAEGLPAVRPIRTVDKLNEAQSFCNSAIMACNDLDLGSDREALEIVMMESANRLTEVRFQLDTLRGEAA